MCIIPNDNEINDELYRDGYNMTRSGKQTLYDDAVDWIASGLSVSDRSKQQDEIYAKGKEQGRIDRDNHGKKE